MEEVEEMSRGTQSRVTFDVGWMGGLGSTFSGFLAQLYMSLSQYHVEYRR
jgi:hypothetical protein